MNKGTPLSPDSQEQPEEQAITALLINLKPNPGPHFYRRLRDAPWQTGQFGGDPMEEVHSTGRIPVTQRRFWPSWGLAMFLFFVVIIVLALARPPLEATAELIAQYFTWNDRDTTTLRITPASLGELEPSFHQSLQEVQDLAAFQVRMPATLPGALTFEGAIFDPQRQGVTLSFRSPRSVETMRLSQRPLGDRESFASIGASAEVEPVLIGGLEGEYVRGGWRLPLMATQIESIAPGMEVTLEAYWDPQAEIQILRWREGTMLFEIFYVGDMEHRLPELTKNDLISLAQNLE